MEKYKYYVFEYCINSMQLIRMFARGSPVINDPYLNMSHNIKSIHISTP